MSFSHFFEKIIKQIQSINIMTFSIFTILASSFVYKAIPENLMNQKLN